MTILILDGRSTRDLIIQTLIDDWPLSMRKIYMRVKKFRSASYHAVYKTVKQLVEEGILEEKDKEYLINKNWVKKIIDFGERLSSIYSRKSSEGPNTFIFDSVAEADNYLMSLKSEENQKKIVQCRHLWWALFRPETAYLRMQKDKIYKNETYVICKGNTVVDKWCAKFEKKIGKNVKLNVDCANNCDVFVRGEMVIEVYYPKRLMKILNESYEAMKSIDRINVRNLLKNFYTRKSEVLVVLNKNRKISERIREETLASFNNSNTSY